MNPDLGKYQERAQKYWFMDGMAEIGFGLICIMLATLFIVENSFEQTPIRDLSFFILAVLGALVVRWIIQKIKEHSTYPRTGYISYKKGKANQKIVLIAIAFTAIIFIIQLYMILTDSIHIVAGPLIAGFIFAFIFSLFAYRSLVYRFYLFALLTLLFGGILSLSGIGDLIGAALLAALAGVTLIASGGITRWTFLQHNPLPGGNDGS
jgi:MFS family permease